MWIAHALLLLATDGARDTTPSPVAAAAPAAAAAGVAAAEPCPPTTGSPPGAVFVTLAEVDASDSVRTAAGFCAWGLELRMGTSCAAIRGSAARTAAAELRVTRALEGGAATSAGAMSRARLMARRLPTVVVDVPAGVGPAVRVQLTGVTVTAQRILGAVGSDDLDALVATQGADVIQLEADRNDAARHLTELRALDQRKLAAGFEIARADDRVRVLDAKLTAARRQLARSRARAALAAGATEELTFSAERADVIEATDR